jgi:cell division protein ZapA
MSAMKQVEVSILGQVYMLGCPEGGETLLSAAVAAVDKEMTAIRDGGKVKARERIAVLAALNLGYQLAESQAAPAPSAPVQSAATASSDDEIQALVRRIDAALGDDGQLL